ALPVMHEYIRERKKVLGVSELHMYDLHTPLVEGAELKLDFEDAFKLVKEGLKPLGEEYIKLLDRAKSERWMDVEETEGKRSGAYSTGVYGIKHPYVLLNYQPTTHDVFTIAHELGHAMHTYHSNLNQPQAKADYKIFVAEVASTVNEVLLLKHVLKTCEDVKLKKYLLSYYMDMIRTTLFRQTQFAEFEYIAHSRAERGEPLTKDVMNADYLALNKKYYGDGVIHDDEIACEWARIPHFYRAFYVYKYATGIISAISIAERIYKEGRKAVADYFKFLSSGGSDSPVELLKLAGVDLEKKDAFSAAMESFRATLEEFKNID
ncbi:MAG: oligoendopeptidase F family protein, partial [Clostridia bacterium]|nr:oligoendopeptidase F family protein [Clostridia bacterium]